MLYSSLGIKKYNAFFHVEVLCWTGQGHSMDSIPKKERHVRTSVRKERQFAIEPKVPGGTTASHARHDSVHARAGGLAERNSRTVVSQFR